MSHHVHVSETTLAAASLPTRRIVAFLLAAAVGLAIGTGAAYAGDDTTKRQTCFPDERPLSVFESGFSSLEQLCDEMNSHAGWGSG